MNKQVLQDLGFEFLGTNGRGTETFVIDGTTVKSYTSGYVRRVIENYRNQVQSTGTNIVVQINKKNPNRSRGEVSVILLRTAEERYARLAEWITNKRSRIPHMVETTTYVTKMVTVKEYRKISAQNLKDLFKDYKTQGLKSEKECREYFMTAEGISWEMNCQEIVDALKDLGVEAQAVETEDWNEYESALQHELLTANLRLLKEFNI